MLLENKLKRFFEITSSTNGFLNPMEKWWNEVMNEIESKNLGGLHCIHCMYVEETRGCF